METEKILQDFKEGKIFLFSDKGLIPLGCCSIYGDWDLHY